VSTVIGNGPRGAFLGSGLPLLSGTWQSPPSSEPGLDLGHGRPGQCRLRINLIFQFRQHACPDAVGFDAFDALAHLGTAPPGKEERKAIASGQAALASAE